MSGPQDGPRFLCRPPRGSGWQHVRARRPRDRAPREKCHSAKRLARRGRAGAHRTGEAVAVIGDRGCRGHPPSPTKLHLKLRRVRKLRRTRRPRLQLAKNRNERVRKHLSRIRNPPRELYETRNAIRMRKKKSRQLREIG